MTITLYELLPAHWRKPLYALYALVGIILGGTQVGYAAADAGQPTWLIVALAVYAFVGGAFGLTAAANTFDRDVVAVPAVAVPQTEGEAPLLKG